MTEQDLRRASVRFAVSIAAAVFALTVVVYLPALRGEFVNYDDTAYVTQNVDVAAGLGWDGFVWSLTAFVNGNWHPVTMWSHMADVSFFETSAAGHHATSVLLHAACAALLTLVGFVATGRIGPAVAAAVLFAVHPLNVESVAWIAERKNPLSTFFWLATILAWVGYRRVPRRARYVAALVFAALALMAKPMAVTLPFTLWIVDSWLLTGGSRSMPASRAGRVRELAPFLALALACGIVTLFAQREATALQSLASYPVSVRLIALPVGYAWYLGKMFWPSGLAVFYPHPNVTASVAVSVSAAAIVAAISAAAWRFRRRMPALAGGWAWYLVTLAPVSGIVQVGSQAYADRYAYVPLIGIFATLAGAAVLASGSKLGMPVAVAQCAAIVALSLATRAQLAHWKDSITLFEHAVQVVPDNAIAWNNLGMAFVERFQTDRSLDCFRRAVAYAPWDTDARSNLGSALRVLGRPDEAIAEFETAIAQAPRDASIRFNLATVLADVGRGEEAEARLREAMEVDPRYPNAPLYLGILQFRKRRLDDAIVLLERAAALDPRSVHAQVALGAALAARGDRDAALRRFEAALRLDPLHRQANEAVRVLRGP